jgi:hypothetical protein
MLPIDGRRSVSMIESGRASLRIMGRAYGRFAASRVAGAELHSPLDPPSAASAMLVFRTIHPANFDCRCSWRTGDPGATELGSDAKLARRLEHRCCLHRTPIVRVQHRGLECSALRQARLANNLGRLLGILLGKHLPTDYLSRIKIEIKAITRIPEITRIEKSTLETARRRGKAVLLHTEKRPITPGKRLFTKRGHRT